VECVESETAAYRVSSIAWSASLIKAVSAADSLESSLLPSNHCDCIVTVPIQLNVGRACLHMPSDQRQSRVVVLGTMAPQVRSQTPPLPHAANAVWICEMLTTGEAEGCQPQPRRPKVVRALLLISLHRIRVCLCCDAAAVIYKLLVVSVSSFRTTSLLTLGIELAIDRTCGGWCNV